MSRNANWLVNISEQMCFACQAIRKGSGSFFWKRWPPANRLSRYVRRRCRKWCSTAALVERDNAEALAAAIETMYFDSELRMRLGAQGLQAVQQFAMKRVAQSFLKTVSGLVA